MQGLCFLVLRRGATSIALDEERGRSTGVFCWKHGKMRGRKAPGVPAWVQSWWHLKCVFLSEQFLPAQPWFLHLRHALGHRNQDLPGDVLRITLSRLDVDFSLIPFEGKVVAGQPGQLNPRPWLWHHTLPQPGVPQNQGRGTLLSSQAAESGWVAEGMKHTFPSVESVFSNAVGTCLSF